MSLLDLQPVAEPPLFAGPVKVNVFVPDPPFGGVVVQSSKGIDVIAFKGESVTLPDGTQGEVLAELVMP